MYIAYCPLLSSKQEDRRYAVAWSNISQQNDLPDLIATCGVEPNHWLAPGARYQSREFSCLRVDTVHSRNIDKIPSPN
jgi:hypothetical protein